MYRYVVALEFFGADLLLACCGGTKLLVLHVPSAQAVASIRRVKNKKIKNKQKDLTCCPAAEALCFFFLKVEQFFFALFQALLLRVCVRAHVCYCLLKAHFEALLLLKALRLSFSRLKAS
jgi:hypothetical protein